MDHQANSAVQQLEILSTPLAQRPLMCDVEKRSQQRSSASLGQNVIHFDSSSNMHDRFMPWHMQSQIPESYTFQFQTLHSQRTRSALTPTKLHVPSLKPLHMDFMPRSTHIGSFGTRLSHHPSNATLGPVLASAYSTVTVESPILENQAAHALTTLRSRQDQVQPFADTCTTSLLCQQQACSKNDCPSSSQVICAAEEIEARFCNGNCAGSLCTGAGCPYNIDPYGYHGFDHGDCSDFWSCQWACDSETCNITPPNDGNASNYMAHDQSDNHHTQEPMTTLVEKFPQEVFRISQPDHEANSEMHCSIDEFTALMDAGEADLNWHFQSCHGQPDTFGCHWKNCQVANTADDIPDNHGHSEHRTYNSHSNSNVLSSPSTNTSASSSPVMVQRLDANTDGYSCMWITDSASGLICGFSCRHGNDMQAHIEVNHIERQLSGGEPGRKKSATKIPRSLTCQWKECKHNLQRKTLRSTQALRQHVFTHSGYRGARCTECGELFVDKANLESHMRRHTGERPFKCKFCDVSFAFRAILITHERTHTGDKVFKCGQCGYETGDSSNFSRHKLIHKEPQYSCELCGKDFCRREHLKRHMRNIHKEDTLSSTVAQLPLGDLSYVDMKA